MRLPSGQKATATELTCYSPLNCHNCLPVFTSHTRTLLSFPKGEPLPEAIVRPSGEKSTQLTLAECPLSCESSLPVATSHMRTVSSSLPLASFAPSGLQETDLTKSL
eukprot:Tamp_26674.p1 GENE.Tamp_26674~~Tamp_26674.p1  ORF type:complete len:107 (-),score=1.24 Tamp_26674:381-701(-)